MTVKELIRHLEQFDGDLLVITTRYSDYAEMEPPEEVQVLRPDRRGPRMEWLVRYYEHQWRDVPEADRPDTMTCVHFEGN